MDIITQLSETFDLTLDLCNILKMLQPIFNFSWRPMNPINYLQGKRMCPQALLSKNTRTLLGPGPGMQWDTITASMTNFWGICFSLSESWISSFPESLAESIGCNGTEKLLLNGCLAFVPWAALVQMCKQSSSTHSSVMDPLAVAILQGPSQLPGQLALVNVAMQVRDWI